jgi:exonuclease III
MTRKLKIASINIHRILLDSRKLLLTQFCTTNDIDVAALQEVRFSDPKIFEPFYTFLSNPEPEHGGTAFLVKKELSIRDVVKGAEGRVITATINNVTFTNVYAPAGRHWKAERNVFFQTILPPFIPRTGPFLLMGDFNAVENSGDRAAYSGVVRESTCKSLLDLTTGFQLVDCWKKLKPNDPGHTFHHKAGSSRLDRIYADSVSLGSVEEISTIPISFSDHLCLMTSLQLQETVQPRRKSQCIWKLNTSIFEEEEYQRRVQVYFSHANIHPLRALCVVDWWERIVKPGIKKITIDYCRQRSQMQKSTRLFYQQCLLELLDRLTDGPEYLTQYQELQLQLRKREENLLKGAAVRARPTGEILDETPSMYHVRREKCLQAKSNISQLQAADGRLLTNSQDISLEIHSHFDKQFSSVSRDENTSANNCFLSEINPSPDLSPSICQNLVAPITISDLKSAIERTKLNKSPGADGIPYEFYGTFFDSLKEGMVEMMNAVLVCGETTETQSLALIKLIPKVKKPKGITDYRPISLLCTDYKLLASILAHRLSKTLPLTISPQQRGSVPGRKIEQNLTLVRDAAHFLQERDAEGAIVAVDFSKAYDLVDRTIIWQIMEKFGYPRTFIAFIQALYSKVNVKVQYGSGTTDKITAAISIRQGCPLSGQLFILYLEPLLRQLERRLTGVRLLQHSSKTCAFIDDVNIFIGEEKDLVTAKEILTAFCCWTGAIVNRGKTYVMGLGRWQHRTDWQPDWATATNSIKLLGITFEATIQNTIDAAWQKVQGVILGLLKKTVQEL